MNILHTDRKKTICVCTSMNVERDCAPCSIRNALSSTTLHALVQCLLGCWRDEGWSEGGAKMAENCHENGLSVLFFKGISCFDVLQI